MKLPKEISDQMAQKLGLTLLGHGQAATMMGVVAVAGQFAEMLVRKGVLSVADAQNTLSYMAEELRDYGDANAGLVDPAFQLAATLDDRAIAIGKKFSAA